VNVGVADAIVTELKWVKSSVSAQSLAIWSTANSAITFLSKIVIDDSITTSGELAPWSAGVGGVGVGVTVVASFQRVDDTVATVIGFAVTSACVRKCVVVGESVITFFISLEDSVTTFDSAVNAIGGVD